MKKSKKSSRKSSKKQKRNKVDNWLPRKEYLKLRQDIVHGLQRHRERHFDGQVTALGFLIDERVMKAGKRRDVPTLHWIIMDQDEKHILHYWPTNKTWWNPNTGEKGKGEVNEILLLLSGMNETCAAK